MILLGIYKCPGCQLNDWKHIWKWSCAFESRFERLMCLGDSEYFGENLSLWSFLGISPILPCRTLHKNSNWMCASADNLAADNAVAAERTKVESVELVLPPHANHQVSVCLTVCPFHPWWGQLCTYFLIWYSYLLVLACLLGTIILYSI